MKAAGQNSDLNTTVTSQMLEHQLDTCDPLACVLFSQSPSVQVYFALRSRLESSSEPWLQEFVELGGLESLLDALGGMTSPQLNGFSDAILQIDCLSCIRAVINAKVGMDALINSNNGIEKLLKGAHLANTLPRKQVFEILSVVCVYDKVGQTKLMDAFEKYRCENHLSHKYSFVVNELKLAETVPHKTSLLTFVNAVLCSTSDKFDRMRIRSQLIGLGLLDILAFLQREDSDEDLYVQLQLFHEKKHEDEISINTDSTVDFNSPQDLVDMIQARVFGGTKMVCFVNILQDLLAIETMKKEKSNIIWQLLERQVNHVVHATEDVESLHGADTHLTCLSLTCAIDADAKTFHNFYSKSNINLPSQQTDLHLKQITLTRPDITRVESTTINTKKRVSCADSGFIGCEDKLSPQVEKRMKNMQAPDYGFTLQHSDFTVKCIDEELKETKEISNISPMLTNISDNMDKEKGCRKQGRKHLSVYDNMSPLKSPKEIKAPISHNKVGLDCLNNLNLKSEELVGSDIRSLNLNVLGYNSCKSASLDEENGCKTEQQVSPTGAGYLLVFPSSMMRNLKWIKLDESLRDEFPHSIWLMHQVRNVQPDFAQFEVSFKETYDWKMAENPLLSNDIRLKLNLFLNRCDEEPTELVKRLVHVDGPAFPLAFIKQLVDILPEHDEMKHLKFYNGNLLELGQAEQFVLHLLDVPDYSTLLRGQLRRTELYATASRLGTILTSMLESSRVILSNKGLAEIFFLILQLGNFLNHGQFNGYAGGFKLASLARLVEVKSNEAGQSLIHFIISTVDEKDDSYLSFLSEIPRLQQAASCSLADIKADFDKMNSQINNFVKQLATSSPIIRDSFNGFLNEVKWKFKDLQSHITELKTQSRRLAEYFCESESFDLQACFQHLLNFFEDLKLCREEMKLMVKQKAMANQQTSMFNQQINSKTLAQHFGQRAGACSSVMEEKRRLVDCLLTELHRAHFTANMKVFTNRSLGSEDSKSETLTAISRHSSHEEIPKTPEQEKNSMELSRISLIGTPMINRPCSEAYDEELTLTEKPKFATSSENDLLDGQLVGQKPNLKIPPVLAIPDRLISPNPGKGHHRSRSDLTNSTINTKWIRYYDQLKQVQAPLAKPESSITLATLNLEAKGVNRYVNGQNEPIALITGPTLKLPVLDSMKGGPVEQERKAERKSALTVFFSKISKRVLKPRNVAEGIDNVGYVDAGGGGGKGENKRPSKMEKNASKSSSLGKISGSEVAVHNQQDKENVHFQGASGGGPFDRQKKNPIRLSNRFKNKIIK